MRKSKYGDPKEQPFTASIYYNLKTYHLKVRILKDVYFTIGEPKEEEIVGLFKQTYDFIFSNFVNI